VTQLRATAHELGGLFLTPRSVGVGIYLIWWIANFKVEQSLEVELMGFGIRPDGGSAQRRGSNGAYGLVLDRC